MTSFPERSIARLDELVAALDKEDRARFERLYHLAVADGELAPPQPMHGWIEGYFGSVDAVRRQRIVRVTNRWTLEGALFNPLRARRPMEGARSPGSPDRDDELAEAVRDSEGDPFCHPLEGTPADPFGRVRGRHAVTASNVAKCDAWHGVIVFDEHHPLRFDVEQVADYLDVAQTWARAAFEADPKACYPFFLWNCLWRSGASIVHGHAQMVAARGMHLGRVEAWRQAALRYAAAHGADYFSDLAAASRALGLAIERGAATCWPALTPFKEKETHIVAPRFDGDLKAAIYHVLHTFVARLGVTSFNLAVYQAPLGPTAEDWSAFPVVVRVIDRGPLQSRTSDIGAMELFAQSVVTTDPFRVAGALRET